MVYSHPHILCGWKQTDFHVPLLSSPFLSFCPPAPFSCIFPLLPSFTLLPSSICPNPFHHPLHFFLSPKPMSPPHPFNPFLLFFLPSPSTPSPNSVTSIYQILLFHFVIPDPTPPLPHPSSSSSIHVFHFLLNFFYQITSLFILKI